MPNTQTQTERFTPHNFAHARALPQALPSPKTQKDVINISGSQASSGDRSIRASEAAETTQHQLVVFRTSADDPPAGESDGGARISRSPSKLRHNSLQGQSRFPSPSQDFLFARARTIHPQSPAYASMREQRQNYMTRDRAEKLAEAREELQDTREELLGARFALRTQRVKLTELRQKTEVAAGKLVSRGRVVLHQHNPDFLEGLKTDYDHFTELQDQLGSAGVEYDQAEQRYNRLEWRYTELEETFVESLQIEDTFPQDSTLDRNKLSETEALTRFTYSPVIITDTPTKNDPHLSTTSGEQVPEHMHSSTVPTAPHNEFSQPKAKTATDHSKSTSPSARSDRVSYHRVFPPNIPSNRKRSRSLAQNESALGTAPWPDFSKRVDSWIYETVLCSPLQKARLKRLLEAEGFHHKDWWQLVTQYWSSDDLDSVHRRDGHRWSTSRGTATPHHSVSTVSAPDPTRKIDSIEKTFMPVLGQEIFSAAPL